MLAATPKQVVSDSARIWRNVVIVLGALPALISASLLFGDYTAPGDVPVDCGSPVSPTFYGELFCPDLLTARANAAKFFGGLAFFLFIIATTIHMTAKRRV
jgi:hypothetical protein